ncbi:DegV family protein [Pseudothermotoga thermarum]|uniref:DegV family protein n=1 Tax=Pseudothermotoga thermarum DSM 5069 TaxID=688269 RepID=F7YXT7_9THEM|nr:DegV family protein [Pseudothermotoga thermarum]AEH50731.1 degV family protein [Pseudothermotoga thermarum DSM 5069]
MGKLKIILDSTSDVPRDWIEKYDLAVIPLHVTWPDGTQEDDTRDLKEIEDFYRRISQAKELPKSSQPSVGEFEALYRKIEQEGYDEILVICISTKLSQTYNSANLAAQQVKIPVYVVDSKLASAAMPPLARRARELEKEGLKTPEIVKVLNEELAKGRYRAIFYVSNFDFLVKGGRVSRVQGFFGSLLNIYVGIWIDPEGRLIPFEKARGKKRASEMLVKKALDLAKEGSTVRLIMVHANAKEDAEMILEELKKHYKVLDAPFTEMGKVITTHVGPGTAGFALEVIE